MLAIVVAQPAVAFTTVPAAISSAIGDHALQFCRPRLRIPVTSVYRMDLDSHAVAGARVAPHHRVMPDDAARRMIERSQHWIARPVAQVHRGHQPADLFRIDEPAVHAQQLIVFGAHAQAGDGRIRVAPASDGRTG